MLIALRLNTLWINASDVFRYFVFVMPMMRDAFPAITDIAPMNLTVFMLWGLWGTILVCATTRFSRLFLARIGPTTANALIIGTAIWAAIFVILWLGLWNINLAPLNVLGLTLSLAWVEMVVAALITRWAMLRA